MIANKLISSKNDPLLRSYLSKPNISLIIYGEKYLYKDLILKDLASKILSINLKDLQKYPYILRIKPINNVIGIDQIKNINKFIELKVPSIKKINRIIIINQADKMSIEASNAFLKNLEEPPVSTVFLISTNSINKMLPTIKSRCLKIAIKKPDHNEILKHFKTLGYSSEDILKAINISNSLPKLIAKILTKKDPDLDQKIEIAKAIVSSERFLKLKLVDNLSKDRQNFLDILFIIKQMSKFGITSKKSNESKKWLNILNKSLVLEQDIEVRGQMKLLLSDYFLNI